MTKPFVAVMIVPTGLGAEIGGHAGDANPAAKLVASVCDKLIVHPNVVNASDINEMTDNMLYVEGSMLDRFLEGHISLKEVRGNKILVAVNSPIRNETINAVSAARATIGADIEMVVLDKPLIMKGWVDESSGGVRGCVSGYGELVKQVEEYNFDALAITTQINVPKETTLKYWAQGGINPWGYVEAMLSKELYRRLGVPVAHSPVECDWVREENYMPSVIDPRMSAEAVSVCYLHCVLKGLHKAPRVTTRWARDRISIADVDCLISPYGCYGAPHRACVEAGIPILMVKENKTYDNAGFEDICKCVLVENYMEAVGYIQTMKIGVTRDSISRPLKNTIIHNNKVKGEYKNGEVYTIAHDLVMP